MLLNAEPSPEFTQLDAQTKECAAALIKLLSIPAAEKLIPAGTDLIAYSRAQECWGVLTQGTVRCLWRGGVIGFLEEGDLIGFEAAEDTSSLSVSSDFGIRINQFSRAEFFSSLQRAREAAGTFAQLLALQSLRQFAALACVSRREVLLSPEVRSYAAGTVIIREGEKTDEVFSLVEGSAVVSVKGVKVGEVLHEELFGTIAAITGTGRTATVTAATDCMALVVPREKFVELIETRPSMVLKLVEDMSRLIVSLNTQVVSGALSKL